MTPEEQACYDALRAELNEQTALGTELARLLEQERAALAAAMQERQPANVCPDCGGRSGQAKTADGIVYYCNCDPKERQP